MKIVGFVVRVECPACNGKGEKVRWQFYDGEKPERCLECKGLCHVEGLAVWADFEKLVYDIVNAAVDKAVKLIRGLK